MSTERRYQQYIQEQLLNTAATKFPRDTQRQMIYQIGFLQAQLAHAMYEDSKYSSRFIEAIEQANNKDKPV